MSMTYEAALQQQYDSGAIAHNTAFGRRVKRVLTSNNANRKKKALARMERHSKVHLGKSETANVDWGAAAIDWTSLLEFLKLILPLILMLFGL